MKVERLHDTGALRIAIDRVPDEGLSGELRLGSDWLAPFVGSVYELAGEGVDVSFHATYLGEHLEARGRFSVRLAFACSRCGEAGELAIDEPWRVIFLPADERDEEESDAGSGAAADIVVATLREGVANLEGPLGEALVLALPGFPTCREDCQGVCAGCGTNLNEGSCSCKETPADSRWSKLAELRDKLGDGRDES